MLNAFFSWIRKAAAEAVVDGVADGVEVLTADGQPLPPRLAALAARLTPPPALPAAEDEPSKPTRKRG
jgi:hypothetical protein